MPVGRSGLGVRRAMAQPQLSSTKEAGDFTIISLAASLTEAGKLFFYKDKPVWMMVYYGWVVKSADSNEVYKILREALMRQPEDYPFRGPREHVNGTLTYRNEWDGETERFLGREIILKNEEVIYEASYMGGLVDVRRGV